MRPLGELGRHIDRQRARVHRLDQFGRTALDDSLGLTVGGVVAEPAFDGSELDRVHALRYFPRNFGNILPWPTAPLADPLPNGLDDRDTLAGRELLANFVLVLLGEQLVDLHHTRGDAGPAELSRCL